MSDFESPKDGREVEKLHEKYQGGCVFEQLSQVVRLGSFIKSDIEHLRLMVEEGVPIREQGLTTVTFSDFDITILSLALQATGLLFDGAIREQADETLDTIQAQAAASAGDITPEQMQFADEANERIAARKVREQTLSMLKQFGLNEEEAAAMIKEADEEENASPKWAEGADASKLQ